jgi:hypothetical protein
MRFNWPLYCVCIELASARFSVRRPGIFIGASQHLAPSLSPFLDLYVVHAFILLLQNYGPAIFLALRAAASPEQNRDLFYLCHQKRK